MDSVGRHGWSGLVMFIGLTLLASSTQGEPSLPMERKGAVSENIDPIRRSIPIEVPPGRNGLTPSLSLIYNPSVRNGFLGAGWDLPIGSISRNTEEGVNYSCNPLTSSTPCFVVKMGSASSEVISRPDLCEDCYVAKGEGPLIQFRSLSGGWEGTDRNGTRYLFGQTTASRQEGPLGTFRWMLDTVTDPHHDTLTYSYYQNQSESLGEIYISRIDYQSNSILFFRSARSDVQTMYTPDFAVATAYRLGTIDIWTNGKRLRKYELGYCGINSVCPVGKTEGSLLGSVTQYEGGEVSRRQTVNAPAGEMDDMGAGPSF